MGAHLEQLTARFAANLACLAMVVTYAYTGSANCDLFQLDDSGTIEPVRKPNGQGVRIIARNTSVQRIRDPVSNYDDGQYFSVTYDGKRSWASRFLLVCNHRSHFPI